MTTDARTARLLAAVDRVPPPRPARKPPARKSPPPVAPVVNSAPARPPSKNHLGEEILPWRATADQVEPGPRARAGAGPFLYRHHAANGPLAGRSHPHAGVQEAFAAADERAHGELHSMLAQPHRPSLFNLTVRARTGDDGLPAMEPAVHGLSQGGYAAVHSGLVAAGFVPSHHTTHNGILYEHPEGHRVLISGGHQGQVEYRPTYGPDHPHEMSRAADAASLRAHLKTGAAFEGPAGGRRVVTDAADHHRAAAFAHAAARDRADEDGRAGDVTRHTRMIGYHSSVAARLDPEGGGATVNADVPPPATRPAPTGNARDAAAAQARRVRGLLAATGVTGHLGDPGGTGPAADLARARRRAGDYAGAYRHHNSARISYTRDARNASNPDVVRAYAAAARRHGAAAEAMAVADPTPHAGNDVSAFAHAASRAAGHGETPPPSPDEAARLAGLHGEAKTAHAVAADNAQDAGDVGRELHHRYHEARHADRERYMRAWSAPEGTRLPSGRYIAPGPILGRHSEYHQSQDVLAAADHRAHDEVTALVPDFRLGRLSGDWAHAPVLSGRTDLPLGELRKSLAAAGYSAPARQSNWSTQTFFHPAGHMVTVAKTLRRPAPAPTTHGLTYQPRYHAHEYDTEGAA